MKKIFLLAIFLHLQYFCHGQNSEIEQYQQRQSKQKSSSSEIDVIGAQDLGSFKQGCGGQAQKRYSFKDKTQLIRIALQFSEIHEVLRHSHNSVDIARLIAAIEQVLGKRDAIETPRDKIDSEVKSFSERLRNSIAKLSRSIEKHQAKDKIFKKQMLELARKIKRCKEQKRKDEFTREFRRIFNKFNINQRYKQGFSRNREDYQRLLDNIEKLARMFVILDGMQRACFVDLQQAQETLVALQGKEWPVVAMETPWLQRLMNNIEIVREAAILFDELVQAWESNLFWVTALTEGVHQRVQQLQQSFQHEK